jgi:hypothetical protein
MTLPFVVSLAWRYQWRASNLLFRSIQLHREVEEMQKKFSLPLVDTTGARFDRWLDRMSYENHDCDLRRRRLLIRLSSLPTDDEEIQDEKLMTAQNFYDRTHSLLNRIKLDVYYARHVISLWRELDAISLTIDGLVDRSRASEPLLSPPPRYLCEQLRVIRRSLEDVASIEEDTEDGYAECVLDGIRQCHTRLDELVSRLETCYDPYAVRVAILLDDEEDSSE